jgi:membrane fusion protein, heavy metal efflux system
MNKVIPSLLSLAWLVMALSLQSCGKPAATAGRSSASQSKGETTAPDRSGGAEAEPSDLDRPVAELFQLTCEHRTKTFECDECRYETGVVRVAPRLLAEGLVKTHRAGRERLRVPMELTGEVQFDERKVSHLSTQAGGVVRTVYVALGDRVKRGQALIEIESIAVGEAEGVYLEAQAALRLARRNHDRTAELRKEGIASERESFEAKQELEAAEIRVESALGRLTRMGMSEADARALSQASAKRGCLVLRAPAGGTVLEMHGVPGEFAKAEESLMTIGDHSTVWVWADVYERDVARVSGKHLERRLTASVAVPAYPGEEYPGTVDLLSPAMEEASRTVKLRVRVENPAGRLLAGMFANVRVFLPENQEALTVPRAAVLEDAGRSFVFLHHHGEYYVRRPVEPGRSWQERVEIRRGLKGGESVIADGSFLMKSDVLRSKMGAGCAD